MNFFLVDDMFWQHPKAADVSDAAAGLWAKAGSYSKYFGTDGHVPQGALRHLSASRRVSQFAAELVTAKLWEVDPDAGGYVFRNWAAYQTSNGSPETRRRAHAAAQKTYRDKRSRAARRDHGDDHAGDHRDHASDHAGRATDHAGDHATDHAGDHSDRSSRARVNQIPDKTTSVSSSATGTRGRSPDDDDRSPDQDQDDPDGWAGSGFITPAQAQAAIATATVRECTGLVIPAEEARAIVADVLGGRQVRDPAGYLRRAIAAEAQRDVALIRWLGGPPPPATPARPSAADRAPSASSARDALDHARHPEGHDPGRVSDPEAAHRGADRARQMLAGRPKPAEAEVAPRPVYTPDGGPPLDPAALRAAQLAAEAEADPEPPVPPPEPGDDEPDLPPEADPADPAEDVPF